VSKISKSHTGGFSANRPTVSSLEKNLTTLGSRDRYPPIRFLLRVDQEVGPAIDYALLPPAELAHQFIWLSTERQKGLADILGQRDGSNHERLWEVNPPNRPPTLRYALADSAAGRAKSYRRRAVETGILPSPQR
jgi:hypothetical protein